MAYGKTDRDTAIARLNRLIQEGEENKNAIIERMLKVTIRDRLVDPRSMVFEWDGERPRLSLRYTQDGNVDLETFSVDDHALGQLAGISRVNKTYINALLDECVGMTLETRMDLLITVLNTHFKMGQYFDRKSNRTKFLHRLVNGELLGVLSRNYNRKLGTKEMLRPFLEQCAFNSAKPVYAHASKLNAMLQCVVPVIYEPVKGEYVAFGATYSNSDYGAGSLTVQGILLRVGSGGSVILNDKLRKIHLGAVISESELTLSEETLKRESMTHISAVRDMVNAIFRQEAIDQALELVRFSSTEKIPMPELLRKVKDVLNRGEVLSLQALLEQSERGIIDLPPVTRNKDDEPEANAWWTAAALGALAAKTEDVAKKESIQELAGRFLKAS